MYFRKRSKYLTGKAQKSHTKPKQPEQKLKLQLLHPFPHLLHGREALDNKSNYPKLASKSNLSLKPISNLY
jgi:hypothetical protein